MTVFSKSNEAYDAVLIAIAEAPPRSIATMLAALTYFLTQTGKDQSLHRFAQTIVENAELLPNSVASPRLASPRRAASNATENGNHRRRCGVHLANVG